MITKAFSARLFYIVLCLALALMAFNLWRNSTGLFERLLIGDIDDLMRLAMLRDWLAGQSWFDTTQYRLLPPEGVALHWSRYIDLGLALLIWPLQQVLPAAEAETLALILWPGLLNALLLLLVGLGTRRILGPIPAVAALLITLVWDIISDHEFRPGRIDHHNLQILGCCLMLYCFGWAGAAPRHLQRAAGICAGLAMAFTLAIGLEMLPVLVLIWLAAGLRLVWNRPGAALWLQGFALSLALAAPLAFAGQTAPAAWSAPFCDVLARPLLSVLLAGIVSSLIGLWSQARFAAPWPRLGVMLASLTLGLALGWPLWGQCVISGPYALMSPEARALIPLRVGDAQPLLLFALSAGEAFDVLMLPLLAVALAAAGYGWRDRHIWRPEQRELLGVCLLIALLGLLASLFQFRAMILGVAAVPLLAGFTALALARRAQSFGPRRILWPTLLLVLCTLNPQLVSHPLRAWQSAPPAAELPISAPSCLTAASFTALNALPAAQIATMTHMAGPLLVQSHHSTPTAPYHRAGDAFWNGHDPFLDPQAMAALIKSRKVDYVLICPLGLGASLPVVAQLLAGELPPWLSAVPSPSPALRLFKTHPEALP